MRFERDFHPIACLCEVGSLHAALEAARRLSLGNDVIELLDPHKDVMDRLVPAYANAALRESEGCMRTKDVRTEMMLFVAGKLDVRTAIEHCGAKENRFVVFASSKKLFWAFKKASKAKVIETYELKLDMDAASKVVSTGLRNESQHR